MRSSMKMIRLFVFISLMVFAGLLVIGCGQQTSNTSVVPSSPELKLEIEPASPTVVMGEKVQFKLKGLENNASEEAKVVWSVIGGIGTIDANGIFTASSSGEGEIEAIYAEQKVKTKIIVMANVQMSKVITKIEISPESISIPVGSTVQFKTIVYSNGEVLSERVPSFEVLDPQIGSISSVGLFQANKKGITKIKAYIKDIFVEANVEIFTPKDTVPPGNPQELTIEKNDSFVLLKWAKNTEDDLAGYKVFRSQGNQTSFICIDEKVLVNEYKDTGLYKNTNYYYEIKAFDLEGNESVYSHIVEITFVSTTSEAEKNEQEYKPIAPSGVIAAAHENSVTVEWGKINNSNIIGYKVFYRESNDLALNESSLLTNNTYIVRNLKENTDYIFYVVSVAKNQKESEKSPGVGVKTGYLPTTDLTPPVKPTGLNVQAGNKIIWLTWNENKDSDLDGYILTKETPDKKTIEKIKVYSSDYSDYSVNNDANYSYWVQAVDKNNNISASSEMVTVMPSFSQKDKDEINDKLKKYAEAMLKGNINDLAVIISENYRDYYYIYGNNNLQTRNKTQYLSDYAQSIKQNTYKYFNNHGIDKIDFSGRDIIIYTSFSVQGAMIDLSTNAIYQEVTGKNNMKMYFAQQKEGWFISSTISQRNWIVATTKGIIDKNKTAIMALACDIPYPYGVGMIISLTGLTVEATPIDNKQINFAKNFLGFNAEVELSNGIYSTKVTMLSSGETEIFNHNFSVTWNNVKSGVSANTVSSLKTEAIDFLVPGLNRRCRMY